MLFEHPPTGFNGIEVMRLRKMKERADPAGVTCHKGSVSTCYILEQEDCLDYSGRLALSILIVLSVVEVT